MTRSGTWLIAAALSTALTIVAPASPASAARSGPTAPSGAQPAQPARSGQGSGLHRIVGLPDLNSAIVAGFNAYTLPADDDGSTQAVPLPFSLSYFGTTYSSLYVNNNGNLTLGSPLMTYTPQSLNQIGVPMIAPFWADVDTRAGPVVTYGYGKVNGHLAFGANWLGVGCYDQIDTVANSFQVLLISRPDVGYGDFDIEFNYGPLTWDSGQASGGNAQCLGGTAARAGYTSGFGASYELPGSGIDGGLLTSNPTTGLTEHSLSSSQPGRYILPVRGSGVPQQPKFAALGDSFSSGEGTLVANFSGAPCDRGADAWPYLMTLTYPAAPPLSGNSFFACTGTTTTQLNQGPTAQLHQLKTWEASNGPPGLLTVTAGGDDLSFAPLLRNCWLVSPAACLRDIQARIAYLNSGAFADVLDGIYDDLLSVAGAGTQIAAVGYPLILPPPSAASDATGNQLCPWLGGDAGPIFAAFQEAQLDLDNVMAQAAAADGIDFVRLGDVLAGHELCTDDPYVVDPGPLGSSTAAAGHPDRAGQLLIAQDVGSQLGFLAGTGSGSGEHLRQAQKPKPVKKPASARAASRFPGAGLSQQVAGRAPRTAVARPRTAVTARQAKAAPPIAIGSALPTGQTSALYTGFVWAHNGTAPYHWSMTSGSLPAGLSLDASTGIVSGTPTGHGTSAFTVTVTDSSSPRRTAKAAATIAVAAVPALTIPAGQLAAPTAGRPYAGTLTARGGLPPYTWSLRSGSLPAGLTLNTTTGAVTGTPGAAGSRTFTVAAAGSSPGAATATATITLTVAAAGSALHLGTPQLPAGAAGTGYTGALPATGGTAPLDWAVTAGSLPPGLTLDPGTGAISGTPTAAGTFSFTAGVSDASAPAQSASENLSITVAAAPALVTTTKALPTAEEGAPYSRTLDVSGGVAPYAWSVASGALPDGLSLDPASGTINGTPTTSGTYLFTVAAADSATPTAHQVTATLSLTVGAALPMPVISVSDTVTAAAEGTSYQASIIPRGGIQPYAYALASGALPPGLSLNGEAGTITGTPTAAGTYHASIAITDSSSPPRGAFDPVSITVKSPGPLAIATTSLPDAAVATAYDHPITVSGGTGADTFAVTDGELPAGLTLDPGTGIIYGMPTGEEQGTRPDDTSTFTVTVTDSASPQPDTASVTLSLTVNPTPTLTVPVATLPEAVQDFTYSQGVYVQGGAAPCTWSVSSGALPAGLSINTGTGLITGTPTGAGTATFTVTATDSGTPDPQTASQTLTLTVAPATPLTVTTVALPAATSGLPYSFSLDTDGGTAPVTWSVTGGALPDGLSLDPAAGTISGTPSGPGTSSVTVQATDGSTPAAQSATATLTIEVEPGTEVPRARSGHRSSYE